MTKTKAVTGLWFCFQGFCFCKFDFHFIYLLFYNLFNNDIVQFTEIYFFPKIFPHITIPTITVLVKKTVRGIKTARIIFPFLVIVKDLLIIDVVCFYIISYFSDNFHRIGIKNFTKYNVEFCGLFIISTHSEFCTK
mgnify:CR=1 FL=1